MSDPIQIIALLVIGAAAILAFFKSQEKSKKIIENGIEVTGIVFENPSFNFDSTPGSTGNYPTIRFVTKEGLWVTEKGDYAFSNFKKGQKITVIYNADNPKEFIYKSSFDLSKINYLFLILGITAIFVGLWFAYKYLTS